MKFNPDEYNVYDSILYKIDNNNIVDVIPPREYHVFDGEYYRVVGIMGHYEKYLDEDFIVFYEMFTSKNFITQFSKYETLSTFS